MSAEERAYPHGTLACPRCGSTVPPEQDWCLECGLSARTVVAPTPPWRVPLAVLAAVAALALAAMAVAFVDLTADPAPPAPAAPPAAQAPAAPPADPSQAAPPSAETVTTPGSTAPITEPGTVTVEREDEPPVTAPAPGAQQQP